MHPQHGALLVFDEVMTGFRVALGGAQSLYAKAIPGFAPDISVFGKVIGGGMPLAAFGASRDIMAQLAPLGPVYQAGTLSGNPVATACGLATLREIQRPGFFDALAAHDARARRRPAGAARDAGVPLGGDSEGGMFGFFFAAALPQDYQACWPPTRSASTASSTPCSIGACIWPLLCTRLASSAPRTATADIDATVAAAREALRAALKPRATVRPARSAARRPCRRRTGIRRATRRRPFRRRR